MAKDTPPLAMALRPAARSGGASVGRFWLQIQSYELETRNIENGIAKIRSECETMVKNDDVGPCMTGNDDVGRCMTGFDWR